MEKRDFSDVRAVLIESNSMLRGDLRVALAKKGIRDPIICNGLKSFLDVAGREMLDLVLCDSNAFGTDLTQAIQRIRRNGVGGNPFVVVIAMVRDANLDMVRTVLDGGVDDLLLKPMPVKQMVSRVDNLIQERKPFVVSSSYVGPSRRNQARPDDNSSIYVHVPNTLRSKVVDGVKESQVRAMIDQAVAGLSQKIAEHPLAAIDRLIRRALARGSEGGEELRHDFLYITELSLVINDQYRAGVSAHIADLATALARVTRRLADKNPLVLAQADLDLVSSLGEVVRRSIDADDGSSSVVHEIAATVERFGDQPKTAPVRSLARH